MVQAARPVPHQLSHGCAATLIEMTDGVEAPNGSATRGSRCGSGRDTFQWLAREPPAVHERGRSSFGRWSSLVDPDLQSA